jgi:hypothetical protein
VVELATLVVAGVAVQQRADQVDGEASVTE